MDLKRALGGYADLLTRLTLHGSSNYSLHFGLDGEPKDNLLRIELGDLYTVDHGHAQH